MSKSALLIMTWWLLSHGYRYCGKVILERVQKLSPGVHKRTRPPNGTREPGNPGTRERGGGNPEMALLSTVQSTVMYNNNYIHYYLNISYFSNRKSFYN
jgi:hypothetical protein